jgi:hypothetical protein
MGDWYAEPPDLSSARRRATADALAARVADLIEAGRTVVIADVADANGADPVLIEALRRRVPLDALGGYAGWNTAGNTIGSALAQGCAALVGGLRRIRPLVAHRLVEDWAYQSRERRTVIDGDQHGAVMHQLQGRLDEALRELPQLGGLYRVAPGSVRLPWDRPFEVDFTLETRVEEDDQ